MNRGLGTLTVSVGAAFCAPAFSQYAVTVFDPALAYGRGIALGQYVGDDSPFPESGRALLWSSPTNYVNLTPAGFSGAHAVSTDGTHQVGWAAAGPAHAGIWSGTASSFIDLHVSSFVSTFGSALSGNEQAGYGLTGDPNGITHALLWHGSAASMVDLQSPGFRSSRANGVWNGMQVGWADGHALLWFGTASGYVDLHPSTTYEQTQATGIHGGEQVGFASFNGNAHACVWHGSATSFVDLNPGPGWGSLGYATNGQVQVGSVAQSITELRAAAWRGSASSMINLQQFLPAGTISSEAVAIDEDGSIFGYAILPGIGQHPVLWTPVPETSTFIVLAIGASLLFLRTRFM